MEIMDEGVNVIMFDIAFIGGGPGGYTGAIKAAQLGLKVALIDKADNLGGTCLNVGCIPSKALLDSSEHFAFMSKDAIKHGIEGQFQLNLSNMMKRKNDIVSELTSGVKYLMKKNKIKVFNGTGQIKTPNMINVVTESSKDLVETDNIVIATGSVPVELGFLKFDYKKVIHSTQGLSLETVPKHLIVIGAGAIGLELGSVWRRLGAKVTVIEAMDKICGNMDREVSLELQKVLTNQGIKILLNTKVQSGDITDNGVSLNLGETSVSGDICLVAVGRKAYTQGLGLENVGIDLSDRGTIEVNNKFQTSVPGIYAIGDVINGAMLAHKAEEEGVAVAEIVSNGTGFVNYLTLPSVIYTHPEFAGVGYTEEQLKEKNIAYKKGKFLFSANGRAKAMGDTDGFVKVLSDEKSDKILGCHIIGARASDILSEIVIAMEFSASSEDVARSFHSHPTLTEVIREACLDVNKMARQS